MGRTQVAICLFFFASACEAADCGSFTGVCPKDAVKYPSDRDGLKCAGSTCTEAECCGKTCKVAFIGKCAATEQVKASQVYYGAYNWSYAGQAHNKYTAGHGSASCCITTCSSAKKITCPSGKSMKDEGQVDEAGEICMENGEDECAKEDKCCETTTCVHSTCNLLVGGGWKGICVPSCTTECNMLGGSPTAAAINACATCVKTKASDKTGCYNCLKCVNDLHWGGKMTVGPPASGTASSAWSSRCLASALLVGGGFFGMMA